MKGAVYEKVFTVKDSHEFQVEKEHIFLHYMAIRASGAAITVGRGGKCNYPITDGGAIVLYDVDMATFYIKGVGGGEKVYIIGTEE